MAKFHLTKSGTPGLCKAQKQCPLGDVAHTEASSFAEAQAWAEEQVAKQYANGGLGGVKKAKGEPAFEGAVTIIPDPVTVETELELDGYEILKGDVILGSKEFKVESVKRGTKNITLSYTDAKGASRTHSVPMMASVKLKRHVETEESKSARNEAWREGWLEKSVRDFKPKHGEILKKMAEDAEKGYALSGGDISRLVEADAEDQVKQGYIALVEQAKTQGDFSYSKIHAKYSEELKNEVLAYSSYGAHRSTSEAYNLHESALAAAKAKFVRDAYAW